MITATVILSAVAVVLALLLWAARSEIKYLEIQSWHVRRTMLRLREGEPLCGEDRYIANNLLGYKLVQTIQKKPAVTSFASAGEQTSCGTVPQAGGF